MKQTFREVSDKEMSFSGLLEEDVVDMESCLRRDR